MAIIKIEKERRGDLKTKGYVLAEHAEAISKVCDGCGIIITVRNTGESSLIRIKDGNPCKGHDILEKTIKQKSLPESEWKKYEDLFGYVGKWKDGLPVGLKAIPDRGGKKDVPIREVIDAKRGTIYTTDADRHTIYTGDYDLHDILQPAGAAGAGSLVDAKSKVVRNILNKMIWENDVPTSKRKDEAKRDSQHYIDGNADIPNINLEATYKTKWATTETWENKYALIRHGAQRDYWSYAVESKEKFFFAVMKMEGDLAAFVGKDVYILETLADVQEFYKQHNIPKPVSWEKSLKDLWLEYGKVLIEIWKKIGDEESKKEMIAFLTDQNQKHAEVNKLVDRSSTWFTKMIPRNDQEKINKMFPLPKGYDISPAVESINRAYESLQDQILKRVG